MGRRLDWLLYGTPPSRDLHARTGTATVGAGVEAAAGRVALANRRRGSVATTPYGFGPPLEGFEPPYPFSTAPPNFDRDAAMSVASISRAQALIVSAVSALPFTLWTIDRARTPAVERSVPQYPWMDRPDPNRTRQWLLAWTTDDLMFHGIAHWEITGRYSTGYPSSFARIEPGALSETASGLQITDPDGTMRRVAERDIVEFLSPLDGVLSTGWRTISTAMQLDAAADRFASVEIPAGILEEQDGSEDMTSEELQEQALMFSAARHTNTTAALNKYLRYREVNVDASAMQLVDGRSYQALECARVGNVPPYLIGAPAGTGMTYLNGEQSRRDLIDFGAAPYIGCIEQTLSGPNVTPRGQAVRLDLNAWLRNPFTDGTDSRNDLDPVDPGQPTDDAAVEDPT